MWTRAFSIDPRSVRLFRALLGLLVLVDASLRWPVVQAMYSDQGVFPRYLLSREHNAASRLTFLYFSGASWPAYALTLLCFLFGVLLLLEIRPRAVSAGLFLCLVSFANRNPSLNFGVDLLLRVIVFWSIWLPASKDMKGRPLCNLLSLAVVLQLSLIYGCAGWAKSADHWFWHPDAAYLALSGRYFTTGLGSFLLRFPTILSVATVAIFLSERFAWLGFFIPSKRDRVRTAVLLLFAGLHLAIALCLDVGHFAFADLVFLSLFLPAGFWDRLHGKSDEAPSWSFAGWPVHVPVFMWFALMAWVAASDFVPRWPPPPVLLQTMHVAGTGQSWDLFAPKPSDHSGWIIAVGISKSGETVDALHHLRQAPDMAPDGNFAAALPHRRWLDLLVQLMARRHPTLTRLYADYLCRQWREVENSELARVDLYTRTYWYGTSGEARPPETKLLLSHECSASMIEQKMDSSG